MDRFHYKGHTCNYFFDGDRYRILDKIRTSAAEAINAKIKRALYFMRFLKGTLLVNYLNIRFELMNLCTKYTQDTGKTDVEDADLNNWYSDLVECSCSTTEFSNSVKLQAEMREQNALHQ